MKKTVMFGNGLNYLSKNYIPWPELLNKIKGKASFENGKLPNTLVYERAVFANRMENDIRNTEYKIKVSVADALSGIETNEFYSRAVFN